MSEGIKESAAREGLEETGYQIRPQSILGCYQGSKGDKSWMYIVMKAKLVSEEKSKVSDSDIKEGRWFGKEEFLDLDNALLVHADMKAVYKAALGKKGLQLERAKLVDWDKE